MSETHLVLFILRRSQFNFMYSHWPNCRQNVFYFHLFFFSFNRSTVTNIISYSETITISQKDSLRNKPAFHTNLFRFRLRYSVDVTSTYKMKLFSTSVSSNTRQIFYMKDMSISKLRNICSHKLSFLLLSLNYSVCIEK